MKNLTAPKLLVGSFVWTLVFFAIAAVAFTKAREQDHDLFQKISEKTGLHINIHGNSFNITTKPDTTDFVESSDHWSFPPPKEEFQLMANSGDIEVISGDIENFEVEATGLLDRAANEHIFDVTVDAHRIKLIQPENVETQDLKVKIIVPKKYRQKLSFTTVSGDLRAEDLKASAIQLNGVSADIDATGIDAKKIDVNVVSGDISLGVQDSAEVHVRSVSGDIDLAFASREPREVTITSVSGATDNQLGSKAGSGKTVKVTTVSGDVSIR